MNRTLLAAFVALSAAVLAEEPKVVITRQISLSERAQAWGLSESEFRHYENLMAGQRGQWSPGLDPITALGVSSESAADRQRFAELFVKTEFERTRKELAFQVAVDAAWQRLFPDTPRLLSTALPLTAQETALVPPRTALILKIDGTQGQAHLLKLLSRHHAQFDVHVVGAGGSDAALREWARDIPLLEQALAEGRATLNHGDQFLGEVDLPAIYRRNGVGQWARIE